MTAGNLVSIEAVFSQDGTTIYNDASLNDLEPMLTVTGTNSDGSTFTIASSEYTLSGELISWFLLYYRGIRRYDRYLLCPRDTEVLLRF